VTFLPGDRVTELYFADQGALDAAFGSEEGKAAVADYQNIAPSGRGCSSQSWTADCAAFR
jgi:hypothetical protein